MKVIIFSGKAEAGKSSAAGMLKWHLNSTGHKAVIVPYGDYIKSTAKLMFDWSGKKDKIGRGILQHWGDIVRKKCPTFWIDTVIRLSNVSDEVVDFFIIDDCRYPEEFECWVKKETPVMLIRVSRPGHKNSLTAEQRLHSSETTMDNYVFDAHLMATDMDELSKEVTNMVNENNVFKSIISDRF